MTIPSTPTERQAAQLLVLLAWRLDGGQFGDADRLLAKLCTIPTKDVAMAGIVLLGELAHSMAPVLRGRPATSSATSTHGSWAKPEHLASAVLGLGPRPRWPAALATRHLVAHLDHPGA
jgi:hypothetical protein